MTALLLEDFLTGMQLVFIPSLFKKSIINSPTLSLPTPLSKLASIPNLVQATAIFNGEPPAKASNPLIL